MPDRQNLRNRNTSTLGRESPIPVERESMDHQTRNEFEHYCALAEIEEDPEKFAEIARNITRLLDVKQAWLNRQRPASTVRCATVPSNVA
jgi:hypothetical protein